MITWLISGKSACSGYSEGAFLQECLQVLETICGRPVPARIRASVHTGELSPRYPYYVCLSEGEGFAVGAS